MLYKIIKYTHLGVDFHQKLSGTVRKQVKLSLYSNIQGKSIGEKVINTPCGLVFKSL